MKNFLKILGVLLCVAVIAFFALLESGVPMDFLTNYKNNFKRNISGIANFIGAEIPMEVQLYLDDMSTPAPKPTMEPSSDVFSMSDVFKLPETEEIVPEEGTSPLTTKAPVMGKQSKASMPIALDMAANMKFSLYKNYIVCASETKYICFDTNGKTIWTENIQMEAPSLKVAGDYVLINEVGAKRISLYDDNKNIYTLQTESNIVSCDLTENGDVVAVTEKEYYKGQVVVYNKKGEKIFAWDSGTYSILDADLSAKRRLAISLLNTESGADSFVSCMTLDGKTRYKTDLFKNSVIFDVEFVDEKLNAFTDSGAIGISERGKTSWEHQYPDKILKKKIMDKNGEKVFFFDTADSDEFVAISKRGKVYDSIKAESEPVAISIKDGRVAYNSGRDIILMTFKGKNVKRATCDSDIRQLYIIDSQKVLAVYSSSIQFMKMNKTDEEAVILLPKETPAPEAVPQGEAPAGEPTEQADQTATEQSTEQNDVNPETAQEVE